MDVSFITNQTLQTNMEHSHDGTCCVSPPYCPTCSNAQSSAADTSCTSCGTSASGYSVYCSSNTNRHVDKWGRGGEGVRALGSTPRPIYVCMTVCLGNVPF